MGLLDNILSGMQSPGGRMGLGLLAAAGPTAQPRSFGQRAMGLLAQMDADKVAEEERKQRAQMQALQEQLLKAQLGERQEAAGDRQRQRDQMLRDEQVVQQFVTPMAGPTPDDRPLMPRIDPMAIRQQGGSQRAVEELLSLLPKPRQRNIKEVGGVLVEVPDEGDVKTLFTPPTKPDKPPSAVQEYEFARQQGYKGSFLDFQLAQRRAGATNVSLSTGDRVPQGVVKQQDEIIDRLTTAKSTNADLGAVMQQLESGTLQFGPIRNLVNTGKNIAGVSDTESRAFASFKSTLEKLRNDSLRLNTGVQTDGDAQRAWNELFQNINDTEFVKQRLGEIQKINQRAAQLQGYRLEVLRNNFGAGPLQIPEIPAAIEAPPQAPASGGSAGGVRRYNPATGRIE